MHCKIKKLLIIIIILTLSERLSAQESRTEYNFLRLPMSAHVAALGGDNISIIEDDPTLIFHNPALISCVSDKSININFMNYMEGVNTGSASFIRAVGEKGTWGVMAQYMDYGEIRETTVDNVETGTFSAKDIMVGGTFTYLLGTNLAGGISAKFITSYIGDYNSIAVGVDLGLNYYLPQNGLSFSIVARNLGGQVKAFEDEFERIPFDLQAGVTKKLGNAPLRVSVTMTRINSWDDSFLEHFVIGAEIFLTKKIYIAGGYNVRRAEEMEIADTEDESSHGAGLSLGGGLTIKKLQFHVAYAKYHVSSSSLNFSLSLGL